MADYILRSANGDDLQQTADIWRASFGDRGDFVFDMLVRCGLLKNAVGAEVNGRLRSCMFIFDGLRVGDRRAAYLYALCTEPAFRGLGLGKAVASYAAKTAVEGGAEAVFLRPGDEGLERWYSESLGAEVLVRSTVEILRPCGRTAEKACAISPAEYFSRREGSLWEVSAELLDAQDCIHRYYGGAFLSAGEGIVCAEKCSDTVLVRELISPFPEQTLSAAAKYFGVSELGILRESSAGVPLMLLPVGTAPAFPVQAPFLPFTLD